MTNELRIRKIKYRVRLFVAIIIAALVGVSVFSLYSERRSLIAAAERQALGYSRALAEHAESAFAESDRVLRDLLHDIDRSGGIGKMPRAELYREMRRQVGDSPQIGALFLVDKNGSMFINSKEFPGKPIDVSDREYFQHYKNTPGADLTLSRPVMSRLVGRWRFNLMRPLNEPSQPFEGIVTVAFEVSYFERFFSAASLGAHGRVLLVREDGAALVCEPHAERAYATDFRKSELFRRLTQNSHAGFYRMPQGLIDGTPRISAYHRVDRFPVVAVISLSEEDVLAPWFRKLPQQAGFILAICLVILYLAFLVQRQLDRLLVVMSTVEGQQDQLKVKAAQIDAANDAILQIDAEGRLVQFNQALCQMTGYLPAELEGRRLHEIVPEPFARELAPHIELVQRQGPTSFDSAYRTKSGRTVHVEVQARSMESEGVPVTLNVARDITQRKQSELREASRLNILERLASGAPLGEILTHIVQFVEQESPGVLCSAMIYDPAQNRLRHGAAPSLPESYNRAVDGVKVRLGAGSCGTAAFQRQRVVVEAIEGHPYWEGFQPARDAGLASCWSEPVLGSDGQLLGTFALYHREPRSPSPEETSLAESAAHLASLAIERVTGEESRRHLEEQLRHVQKIEAIGQLAAGVAHDFNNLLTPILVYAELIKREQAHDPAQAKKADGILSAGQKAKDLTQKLLSFGRKQMLKMEALDLNEVLTGFKEIMLRTIRENIVLDMQLQAWPADVRADRGQLEQILLNLAVNAQDAIDGNGVITVSTRHAYLDEEFVRPRPNLKPGGYLALTFADDGRGMPAEVLEHIFEPFFTTKGVGRGTGLGLATVYGIVQQHEGYIEVQSEAGQGARFDIYLPAATGPRAQVEPRLAAAPSVLAGSKSPIVLVVEDNEMVREMAVELLKSSGCRVLSAEVPSVARRLWASESERIDLLVTDVVMPEMTGPELYANLSKLRPDLPVLYMSGYAEDLVTRGAAIEPRFDFLRKPFTAEQFLESVHRKLAQRAEA